jgi:hypothetical protein
VGSRLPPLPLPEPPRNRSTSFRSALLVIVLVGVTSGLVGGTAATLNATTTNPGFIATPSLPGPTGPLTATISNGDISLTWIAGGLGNGNEYNVYRSNNGASLAATPAACPVNTGGTGDQSYTPGTSVGFTNLAALTDAGTATITSASNGYLCYMLFGAFTSGVVPSAPVWISHPIGAAFNPIANAHLPLIVTKVDFWDGSAGAACLGATCKLDIGDVIQLTYNQPTNKPAIAGATTVCVKRATGVIYIGDALAGTACAGSGQVGEIDPPGSCVPSPCFTWGGPTDQREAASYTWNNGGATPGCPAVGVAVTAFTVLCVVMTGHAGGNLTIASTGWTLLPNTVAAIKSGDAVVANRVAVCTASAACQPTTTTEP